MKQRSLNSAMNIAVGFTCLVAVVVTAGVTGLPERQLAVGEQLDDYDDDLLERKGSGGCGTRTFCGAAGGRCQPKDDECDGELRTNKFYCKGSKNCGCCIPPGCVYRSKAYPDGSIITVGCFKMHCNKGNLTTDSSGCDHLLACRSEDTRSACGQTDSCPCHFVYGQGCIMGGDNIPGWACRCEVNGTLTNPDSNCTGTVVKCADIQSPFCQTPGKAYDNCMQGVGNCCGYAGMC